MNRNVPSIIFGIEQKVSGHDCNADSDHYENEKHEQHEAVYIVDLVRPK